MEQLRDDDSETTWGVCNRAHAILEFSAEGTAKALALGPRFRSLPSCNRRARTKSAIQVS